MTTDIPFSIGDKVRMLDITVSGGDLFQPQPMVEGIVKWVYAKQRRCAVRWMRGAYNQLDGWYTETPFAMLERIN